MKTPEEQKKESTIKLVTKARREALQKEWRLRKSSGPSSIGDDYYEKVIKIKKD